MRYLDSNLDWDEPILAVYHEIHYDDSASGPGFLLDKDKSPTSAKAGDNVEVYRKSSGSFSPRIDYTVGWLPYTGGDESSYFTGLDSDGAWDILNDPVDPRHVEGLFYSFTMPDCDVVVGGAGPPG